MNRRPASGFTFAEMLAAMLFLAILVPVVIEGMTLANRMGVVAERGRWAAELAERKLNEIVLNQQWRDGESSGDFGDEFPDFRWTLLDEVGGVESLRLLTVVVSYPVQDQEYTTRLSTLVEETEP